MMTEAFSMTSAACRKQEGRKQKALCRKTGAPFHYDSAIKRLADMLLSLEDRSRDEFPLQTRLSQNLQRYLDIICLSKHEICGHRKMNTYNQYSMKSS